MTIEEADKIADVILSAPEVYDSPPTKFPAASGATSDLKAYGEATVPNAAWMLGLPTSYSSSPIKGVYSCKYGFQNGYESLIKTWDYTQTGHYDDGGRYVTFDDIKMMAYVGIENYRAKLHGHRWRFNEKGINTVNDTWAYQRGSIVRQDDGKRWIKCRSGNVIPIPGVTIDGWVGTKGDRTMFWRPMTRRQAFKNPVAEYVPLIEGVDFPTEKVTRLVKAATIEGHNDLVQLRNVWDYADMNGKSSESIIVNTTSRLNYEGRMVVYVSELDGLDKKKYSNDIEEKSIVWVTSNTIPVYSVKYKAYDGGIEGYSSLEPINLNTYGSSLTWNSTSTARVFRSSFIPLAEGRQYHIYIKREDSRIYTSKFKSEDVNMKGGNLVVVRVKTDAKAMNF